MGIVSVVDPEATENIFLNPIFDNSTTSWSVNGTGVLVSTDQWVGLYALKITALAGGIIATVQQTLSVTATSYTVQAMVKRPSGAAPTSSHTQVNFNNVVGNWDSITHVRDGWYLCLKTGTPTAGSRTFGVAIYEIDMLVDALQLENKAYHTTLAYGNKKGNLPRGYYWSGAPYTSSSIRDSQERSGGRVIDLASYLTIEQVSGSGSPPVSQSRLRPAQQDGSIPGPALYGERVLQLTGQIIPSALTLASLLSKRKSLHELLKRDVVIPEQPFVLRFTGGSEPLESAFFYESGLEGNLIGKDYSEKVPLRLFASDPAWYSPGNAAGALDPQDTLTTNYLLQKSRAGVYSNLATSLNGAVRTMAKDSSGNLWVGGDMTSPGTGAVKWNGSSLSAVSGLSAAIYALLANGTDVYAAGANNSVARSAAGAAFSALTVDLGANGPIYAAYTDGTTLWVGGDFSQIGGVAANNIAALTIAGPTWAALGAGTNGPVNAIRKVGTNLYVGGSFGSAGAVANTGAIARWNLSSPGWNAMGAGATASTGSVVYGIDADGSSNVYVVGYFGAMGGVSGVNTVGKWDGSVWSSVGSGFALSRAYCIEIDASNNIYVGGDNVRIGVSSFANLWKWNGSSWATLTGGDTNGAVYALYHDGTNLWLGGAFTLAGGVASTARFCRHNGSAFQARGSGIDNGIVYSIVPRGTSFILAGSFINGDGQANGDYIIRWDGSAYQVMSTGLTNVARAMATTGGASDNVYVGGEFSDWLTMWNGTTFTAQGTGSATLSINAAVYALAKIGNILYLGGLFTTANSITVNYIYSLDLSLSNKGGLLSSGMNGPVYALLVDTSSKLYLAGGFTTAGGVTVNYVCKFDPGGTFSALGSGLSSTVRTLAFDSAGRLWAGGEDGLLAYFDGANWTTIDTDTTAIIYSLAFDRDGNLHIGGSFTSFAGLNIDGYALYAGGGFIPVELDLPSAATVYSLLTDAGELSIGFNTAGSSVIPGTASISNSGSGKTFPVITINGPGTLRQLINATTRQRIYFNTISIASGEYLTLDLSPFAKTLVSSLYGDISGKIIQSQADTWCLLPGINSVQLFVDNASATASMQWRLAHEDVAGVE